MQVTDVPQVGSIPAPNKTLQHFKSNTQNIINAPIGQPLPTTQLKTLSDLQLTDDFEPGEFDWLIEDIFDKGRLHMIAGPQGSGKTRFLLRMIDDRSKGLPFLGHNSTPSKFVYIDAARDKKSIKVALRSLGINPSDFFIIDWSAIHNSKTFSDLLKMIPQDVEVIFIDNLAMMLSSENHSDPSSSYTTVFKFLAKLKTWMIQNNKTIIFTHTFIKAEAGHKYASPRSKVYGAQAWLQSCETSILFDEENPQDLHDPYRLLDIIVKNYQPKDHPRRFKMQDDGRLVSAPKLPSSDVVEIDKQEKEHIQLLTFIPALPEKSNVQELARKTNLPVSSIYRHLKKLQTLGLVTKDGKDYKRT